MRLDIDDAMRMLERPDHPGLDGLEDRIFSAIDASRRQNVGARATLGLAAGAMLLGMAGATIPYKRATAAMPSFIGEPGSLAPSSLLLRERER